MFKNLLKNVKRKCLFNQKRPLYAGLGSKQQNF